MTRRHIALLMAALLALPAAPLRAQPALPDTPAAFGVALKSWVAKHRVRQAFVVARREGRIVHRFAIGGIDPARPVPLASLSKAITGACVAALIRDGRLALDTPVSVALAKFIARHAKPRDSRLAAVTIAQLLTHRAGFATGDDDDPASGRNLDRYLKAHAATKPARPALLAAVLRAKLATDPGARYAYGNAGYFVLGAIIEEASGRAYPDYCREAVLKRLGIAGDIVPSWRVSPADGGWRMTAADYLAFFNLFDPNDTRLGAAATNWMLSPEGKEIAPGSDTWYGLGTWLRKMDGRLLVWHRGVLDYEPDESDIGAVAANFVAYAAHVSDGTSWFVYVIRRSGNEPHEELFEALMAAYRGVKDWR